MEKIMTKEILLKNLESIVKIQKEIRQFIPVVEEELKSFSDSDYMLKVCNNRIDLKIRTTKEGVILFECCHVHNRRYFDKINRQKLLGFAENKAEIEVNVTGLSKFIMDCPRAGKFLCKLRYFIENEVKQEKEEM